MFTSYNRDLLKNARLLRKNSTLSEVILWSYIKRKKLGCTFLRQKPLLNYIVDFYCPKLKLVIEVDGSSHELKYEIDNQRDIKLREENIHVLRIKHNDVLNNIDGVISEIRSRVKSLSQVST